LKDTEQPKNAFNRFHFFDSLNAENFIYKNKENIESNNATELVQLCSLVILRDVYLMKPPVEFLHLLVAGRVRDKHTLGRRNVLQYTHTSFIP